MTMTSEEIKQDIIHMLQMNGWHVTDALWVIHTLHFRFGSRAILVAGVGLTAEHEQYIVTIKKSGHPVWTLTAATDYEKLFRPAE